MCVRLHIVKKGNEKKIYIFIYNFITIAHQNTKIKIYFI